MGISAAAQNGIYCLGALKVNLTGYAMKTMNI